ncbi:hypothetical protein F0342_10765 [Bacillus sp. CH30_1T]|jgi:hypothetical protein|uniref:hypothetical protein n=1 Tax=Bacillus sp. CH30_1T TaxID=2604836 RepID=UPI0011ECBF47|nr:hypothetical protein [Bacillus sp. CH30_1T]KAA0564625.1 hypothetical protein F0342_10765 [Bacillus sp. CH30_1T]
MRKFILACILLFYIPLPVFASKVSDQSLVEEMKLDGYKTMKDSIRNFEKSNNVTVKLPKVPFNANIKLGKDSDSKLSLKWFDTRSTPPKSFNLIITSQTNNKFLGKTNSETVLLKDGIKGYYYKNNFHTLTFSTNGLNYQYSIKDTSEFTKEEIIEIANNFK